MVNICLLVFCGILGDDTLAVTFPFMPGTWFTLQFNYICLFPVLFSSLVIIIFTDVHVKLE